MIRRALLSAVAAASFVAGLSGTVPALAAPVATATAVLPPDLKAAVIAETTGPALDYAGKVPGTNAYIGVSTRGSFVEVYVCDSDKIAVWLKGTNVKGKITAKDSTNKTVFKATVKGSGLTGSVLLGGKTIAVKPVKVSYPDGVWKAFDVAGKQLVKAGWVLLPDGTQRGGKIIGADVATVEALGLAAGGPDVGGDGKADSAVPAGPVAFKKQVTKKDPPPAPNCAHLESEFNRLMEINNDTSGLWSDADKRTAGNSAHDLYKTGMSMGCSFSPSPSGPGTAS